MSDNQQTPPEETPEDVTAETAVDPNEEPEADKLEEKKKKERRRKVIVVLIWILLIVGFAFLTLFFSSRIGQFDSIADMFDFIGAQFE